MVNIACIAGGVEGFTTGKSEFSPIILIGRAFKKTIDEYKIPTEAIDLVIDCAPPPFFLPYGNFSVIAQHQCGLLPKPVIFQENGNCSASLALYTAMGMINSGCAKVVLIRGLACASTLVGDSSENILEVEKILSRCFDTEWDLPVVGGRSGLYAIIASAYLHKYGVDERVMAQVVVKNRGNAILNPHSCLPMKLSVEEVINSEPISHPLRTLHCSCLSDGAVCLIVAEEEKAYQLSDDPVWITGTGIATDAVRFGDRMIVEDGFTSFRATKLACQKAYEQAGISDPVSQINLFEIPDTFAIAELIACEDLGLCERGKAGDLAKGGQTGLYGKMPVNVSGGELGMGIGFGATGLARIVEIFKQLRGEAKKRQVSNPATALLMEMDSLGAISTVTIFHLGEIKK